MNIKDSNSRLRIIVMGYIVRGPLGGMVWSNLQYLMGLAELGHEVYFLEDSDDYPSCYDPQRHVTDTDPTYGLAFCAQVMEHIGFKDRWAYYDAHQSLWHGPCAEQMVHNCSSADLVINLCGVNPLREWTANIPVRVLVDEDPSFTQIRHLTDDYMNKRAQGHNRFLSFAENIGQKDCLVPDDGYPWIPTRQPVVLSRIQFTKGNPQSKFTTVMQWESYPPREYNGMSFGMKSISFEPYWSLPKEVTAEFELALGGSNIPKEKFQECGWQLIDPLQVTKDPWSYQRFISDSKAEIGIAKHGYVVSKSGWFSERTVCYLTHGRPAVVQETGFSNWLSCTGGLYAYDSIQSAVRGVEKINQSYDEQCRMARAVAEEYFNSSEILSALIATVMNDPYVNHPKQHRSSPRKEA